MQAGKDTHPQRHSRYQAEGGNHRKHTNKIRDRKLSSSRFVTWQNRFVGSNPTAVLTATPRVVVTGELIERTRGEAEGHYDRSCRVCSEPLQRTPLELWATLTEHIENLNELSFIFVPLNAVLWEHLESLTIFQ